MLRIRLLFRLKLLLKLAQAEFFEGELLLELFFLDYELRILYQTSFELLLIVGWQRGHELVHLLVLNLFKGKLAENLQLIAYLSLISISAVRVRRHSGQNPAYSS